MMASGGKRMVRIGVWAVGSTMLVWLVFSRVLPHQEWSGSAYDCCEYSDGCAGSCMYAETRCPGVSRAEENVPHWVPEDGNCTRRSGILQPRNVWSSLAYFLAGFVACFSAGSRVRSAHEWFGPSMLVLGTGSVLFHASESTNMQWLDAAGMLFVLVALFIRASMSLEELSEARLRVIALGADSMMAWVASAYGSEVAIKILLPFLLLLVWQVAHRCKRSCLRFYLASGVMAVGFLLHHGDKARCLGAFNVYGHATWHATTALALYLMYDFFSLNTEPAREAGRIAAVAPNKTP